MAQSKQQLITSIKESQLLLESLSDTADFEIRISSNLKDFDSNDASFFKDIARFSGEDTLRLALQNFFNNCYVDYTVLHPYSFVDIRQNFNELSSLLGGADDYFLNNYQYKPIYYPKTVTFMDNTIASASEIVESVKSLQLKYGNDFFIDDYTYLDIDTNKLSLWQRKLLNRESDYLFVVNSTKLIKEIEFIVKTTIQSRQKYALDEANRIYNSSHGIVELLSIDGNKVIVKLPMEANDKLDIEGIYSNGKYLKVKSKKSRKVLSSQKKATLKKLKSIYELALSEIELNSIKTSKELTDFIISELGDDVNAFLDKDEIISIIEFEGPIFKVYLIDDDDDDDELQYSFQVKFIVNHHDSHLIE